MKFIVSATLKTIYVFNPMNYGCWPLLIDFIALKDRIVRAIYRHSYVWQSSSVHTKHSSTNKYTTVKAIRSNDFKLVSVTRTEKTCFVVNVVRMTVQSFLNWLSIKTICFCFTLSMEMYFAVCDGREEIPSPHEASHSHILWMSLDIVADHKYTAVVYFSFNLRGNTLGKSWMDSLVSREILF